MTLPELAVRRPITILVSLISILVIGIIALTRLPLAAKPEIEEPRLNIIVDYPNATASSVERLIAKPLEEAMAGLEGMTSISSNCDSGSARIRMRFSWDMDMDMVRAEIRDRLDRAREELPDDVERVQISTGWRRGNTGDEILEGRISSIVDLSKNYELLERKIIRPLERIPGVAVVDLDGVNPREIKINLDLPAMKRHRVDAGQIMEVLRENNVDRSLGVVRNTQQRFTLRAVGSFQSVEQIRRLPIGGTNLVLEDLAEVTYKEPPLEYVRHLDGKRAVGVTVSKESSANTVEVTRLVRESVAAMDSDPELEGITFLVWEDQGKEILNTLTELQNTGLLGAFLACIILFLFLRRVSSTLIAVTCIPFSLVVACGFIWSQGKSLNTISLLGLIVGIGMLVDNAVVVMENIDRYQQKGYRNRVAALLGAREVSVAVFAATLTSVIVFLPLIFSKPNRMNLTFKELATTICFTLLASLFVSQTLIPLASAYLGRKQKKTKPGKIMPWLILKYGRMLRWTLGHRWLPVAVGLVIIGSTYIPFKEIEVNFEPNENEMYVGMNYRFSESLSLLQKEAIVTQVEEALIPHLEKFNAKSIYSWCSDRPFAITRLYMEPGKVTEEYMNEVRRQLPNYIPKVPGVRISAADSGRPWERNRGKRLGFQLQGPDTEKLAEITEEAKTILEGIPGLFDHYTDAEGGATELHTRIDRERARAYGVDVERPGRVVGLTFRGSRLPRFKGPDGEIEMRMLLNEEDDASIDQLRGLTMADNAMTGAEVPLESVAEFAMVKAPEGIRRENRITSLWVGARFQEGSKDEWRDKAVAALSEMALPYGYRWDFNPGRRDARQVENEFLGGVYMALLLVFAVMAGLFESIRQALALMVSLPFAVAGAYWALHLTGTDMDQSAAVGVLLLLGIVVNNGIVMIEHINTYRRAGMSRTEAMVRGGRERLRPILITALTTLIGLVPMAVQQPALAGMYFYSMAFVIMGGLMVSTLLTLVLLPTTICLMEDFIAGVGRVLTPWRKKEPSMDEAETI